MFDDTDGQVAPEDTSPPVAQPDSGQEAAAPRHSGEQSGPTTQAAPPRAIFIGHGKKRGPLDKLVKILTSFQIPHKVVVDEANLGRPIPQKVRETMLQCGSAILIFPCDQKFTNDQGEEVWRPSENVVHELGAASFAYEDRVVIFKEKGIHFPTNFQSIGYIEFEENAIGSALVWSGS
jgi:predicted nucleotide-binding protein